MQQSLPQQEHIPRALVFHLNEYGQLRVKMRLVLTASEVAELLTIGTQKARWLMYRREIPSFHLGTRRVVSLDALEHYIREREIEEQQDLLYFLERYYGSFRFGDPHPEIQRAQERLNAMQHLQGQVPAKGKESVSIEAALYHITITESGRLECTPRWLLSMSEVAQLLGISRTLLWELAKEEGFPSIRLHSSQYVRVEALLAWIRTKEHSECVQATPAPVVQKTKRSPKTETKSRRKATDSLWTRILSSFKPISYRPPELMLLRSLKGKRTGIPIRPTRRRSCRSLSTSKNSIASITIPTLGYRSPATYEQQSSR